MKNGSIAKNAIKSAAALLLALLMLLAAVSCDGQGEDTPDGTVTEAPGTETEAGPALLEIIKNGKSNYAVVRPDNASNTMISAARQVVTNFKTCTGADLTFKTDFIYPSKDTPETMKYEILVGLCDRDETREAIKNLRSKDFFAGVIGTKIVLVGLTDEMTRRAVDNFISKVLTKKTKTDKQNFSVSTDDNITFTFSGYTMDSCRLLGADLTDYEITYCKTALYSAELTARYFADTVADGSGFMLPIRAIQNNGVNTTDREILFGAADETGAAVTERHGFSVLAKGTKLYVSAECELGYAAALKYLTGTLFKGDNIEIPEGFSYTGSYTEFSGNLQYVEKRLGTYRVLFNNIYGNCDTSLYPAPTRNQMLAELHTEYSPDFLCLQECSSNSRGASSYITTMVRNGYLEVVVTVNNKDGVNYTPLLYRADKFTLVDSGYHLYSDGANDKSKSITWGVFDDKATGARFAVMSTHFYWTSDDLGQSARLKDADQIDTLAGQIAQKYGCPVIAGGDLNCNVSSTPIRNMLGSGFSDIQKIAEKTENSNTHHSYATFDEARKFYAMISYPSGDYSKAIDHAFVWNSARFSAKLFAVLTDEYALLSTDHCPILVDFDIKK